MSLGLIAIGRMRPGPEAELFERYLTRIKPALAVTELPESRGTPAEIKRREGNAMLAALPGPAYAVALTPDAPMLSSEAFAKELQHWLDMGRKVHFLIGGAEGLGDAVLESAHYSLSFGKMIWPHMLARVMLAEQIYRARCIATGHPYHRG